MSGDWEKPHEMCGTATVLVQLAPDVWHCHRFRASCAGCVALPPFSRIERLSGGGEPIAASHAILDSNGAPPTRAASFSRLAPLTPRKSSGAIYFSRNEPFASLPPHQDEPDDSDDDQEYLACRDYRLSVHGQPPFSRSCPSAAKHLVRDSSVRRRKPTGPEGSLQVNFRNREKPRRMCGTATTFAQLGPNTHLRLTSPPCAPAQGR